MKILSTLVAVIVIGAALSACNERRAVNTALHILGHHHGGHYHKHHARDHKHRHDYLPGDRGRGRAR